MLIGVLAFLGVFVVAALVLTAMNSGAEAKEKAVARLNALMPDYRRTEADLPDLLKHESLSSIPLLSRWLSQADLTPKLKELLAQANVPWTPARLLLLCTATAVIPGYLVYLRTNVLLVSAMAGAALGSIPFLYVLYMRRKRFNAFEQGLPGALDLMVSALRSGHSLVSAISLVAREVPDPIGREFRICFDEQNYGLELRTAMDNLTGRVPIQDVRMVVTAILIQKETGGNLAEVLDKCGSVIRERFRLKKEIRVRTAQGRLTGIILTLLPVILGFLMFLVNPHHVSLLWTKAMGLKMMYTAIVMTIIGGLIIRKIVNVRV